MRCFVGQNIVVNKGKFQIGHRYVDLIPPQRVWYICYFILCLNCSRSVYSDRKNIRLKLDRLVRRSKSALPAHG